VLYLAELNKPIGFGRPSLQLLAKQPYQDNWQAVNNEEPISLEGTKVDVSKFKDGVLVLVEIAGNRQVSRINEASRQLVSYLQNFSRLQDKARSQEEEIETWKQSLTFQSQELNRREMELESQEEEIQRLYEKYKAVQEEARVLESKRQEITALEMNLVEQQRAISQQRELLNQQIHQSHQSRLGEDEALQIQALASALQAYFNQDPTGLITPLQAQLTRRQQALEEALAHVEQEQQQAQQQKQEWEQSFHQHRQRRQDCLKLRASLDSARSELRAQEIAAKGKQDHIQRLTQLLSLQEEISNKAFGLVNEYDFIVAVNSEGSPTDKDPALSIEELTRSVEHLRRLYEQRSEQVNDQLKELEAQQRVLDELQDQLKTASDEDRFDLEMDIDYAQSACQALQETLKPQQESLQRDYEELTKQEARLNRLTGEGGSGFVMPTVDIGPILAQLDEQRQIQQDEKLRLEGQLQQLSDSLRAQQETLSLQQRDIDHQWKQLDEEEEALRGRLRSMAEALGRVQQKRELLVQEQALLKDLQSEVTRFLIQQRGSVQACCAQVEELQTIISTLIDPTPAPNTFSPEGAFFVSQ
jgi:DNA repair exonuclease SbcCD ATPase subunit